MTMAAMSRPPPPRCPLVLVSTATENATGGAPIPVRVQDRPSASQLHPEAANPGDDEDEEDHICRGEN
jgi:hypothetical protein